MWCEWLTSNSSGPRELPHRLPLAARLPVIAVSSRSCSCCDYWLYTFKSIISLKIIHYCDGFYFLVQRSERHILGCGSCATQASARHHYQLVQNVHAVILQYKFAHCFSTFNFQLVIFYAACVRFSPNSLMRTFSPNSLMRSHCFLWTPASSHRTWWCISTWFPRCSLCVLFLLQVHGFGFICVDFSCKISWISDSRARSLCNLMTSLRSHKILLTGTRIPNHLQFVIFFSYGLITFR